MKCPDAVFPRPSDDTNYLLSIDYGEWAGCVFLQMSFHFLSSRYLMIGRERRAAQYRVLLPGTADGIFP